MYFSSKTAKCSLFLFSSNIEIPTLWPDGSRPSYRQGREERAIKKMNILDAKHIYKSPFPSLTDLLMSPTITHSLPRSETERLYRLANILHILYGLICGYQSFNDYHQNGYASTKIPLLHPCWLCHQCWWIGLHIRRHTCHPYHHSYCRYGMITNIFVFSLFP